MKSCEGTFPEPCSIKFDPARPALALKQTVRRAWFHVQIFGRTLFPYQDKEFVQLHTLPLFPEWNFRWFINLKKTYTTVKDRTGVTAVLL